MKELLTDIMREYADAVEGACVFMGEVAENIIAGVIVFLAWVVMAITIPVWYLPYKYFTGKGVKADEQKASEEGVQEEVRP